VGADHLGSSFARVPGTADGPTLAVVGHIDEIGVHISHIEDSGYLRFGQVGGWDPVVLIGQRVTLSTRNGPVPGVIGRKPIHLLKDEARKQTPELKDLHIDIGVKDADEARELVRIGDVAVIDAEPVELRHGRVVSRALDNRVGCYVAAEAARLVAATDGAPGDVVAFAVVQEETTFAGARTSAFAHEPGVAIVVDLTFATDQPGIELGPITKHTLESGPVIARGTTLHPLIFELLYEAGEAEGIPFTVESLGKGTGTDADAIHLSRSGVPTGLISVPCRYMHSPVEMVSLEDIDAAARLIAAFAQRLKPDVSFER
jgi:putative aminopeptidase FrvX